MNNNNNYINGVPIGSEVLALKSSLYSMQSQANYIDAGLSTLCGRTTILENKMKTIENLLGIKFGEDGGIKVMKEKE